MNTKWNFAAVCVCLMHSHYKVVFAFPMFKRTSKCTQSKVCLRTIAVLHQIKRGTLAGSMAKGKYFVALSVGAIDEVLSLTFSVSSIVSHSVY